MSQCPVIGLGDVELENTLKPRFENAQPYTEEDQFHFDSSDDDIPLQQNNKYQRTPSFSVIDPDERFNSITPAPDAENAPSAPRRALRARKPEQQMPYTLDLIRHRDQFRRRGLKPVHNPDEPRPARREEDDQYQGEPEEEQEIDNDERYVSRLRNDGLPPVKRRRLELPEDVEKIHIQRVRPFMDPELLFSKAVSKSPKPLKPSQFGPQVIQQVTPDREVNSKVSRLIIGVRL